MGKTNHKLKPDTETIRLTYDELEIALIALSIRQEELREARLPENNNELEVLWYVCDKMDFAQRNLESKMTQQVSEWLKSVDKKSNGFTQKTKNRSAAKTKPGKTSTKKAPQKKLGVFARLSRITRL